MVSKGLTRQAQLHAPEIFLRRGPEQLGPAACILRVPRITSCPSLHFPCRTMVFQAIKANFGSPFIDEVMSLSNYMA